MVVQTAIVRIAKCARPKFLHGARQRVPPKVVKGKNLGHMCLVVLRGPIGEIRLEMGEGGDGTTMVERVSRVWQDQNQVTAIAANSQPLAQGGQRVGQVFEAMRGEHKIKAAISHAVQSGRLANPLPAGRPAGAELKWSTILQTSFPGGGTGEVEIVHAGGVRVYWQDPVRVEDLARPSNFEPRPVPDSIDDRFGQRRMSRKKTVEDRSRQPSGAFVEQFPEEVSSGGCPLHKGRLLWTDEITKRLSVKGGLAATAFSRLYDAILSVKECSGRIETRLSRRNSCCPGATSRQKTLGVYRVSSYWFARRCPETPRHFPVGGTAPLAPPSNPCPSWDNPQILGTAATNGRTGWIPRRIWCRVGCSWH